MERQDMNTGVDFHSPEMKGFFMSIPLAKLDIRHHLINPYHITMEARLIAQQY